MGGGGVESNFGRNLNFGFGLTTLLGGSFLEQTERYILVSNSGGFELSSMIIIPTVHVIQEILTSS